MTPDDWTRHQADAVAATRCADCSGPLDGTRWRCPSCVEAADVAVVEITDRAVKPSDVARIRGRTDGA